MKNILKLIITYLFLTNIVYSNENNISNTVDCIILEDENSIICKYVSQRQYEDRNVTFSWIEPDGYKSRQRVVRVPQRHASVYDFRYMEGRTLGKWTLEVLDNNKTYTTNFIIE